MENFYSLNFLSEDDLKYDSENSGIDIHCPEDLKVPPKEKKTINLKLKCQLLKNGNNSAFWLIPRSSFGSKTPLIMCNSVGLIDSGYRGELKAVVYNTSDEEFNINKSDRLFQIVNPDMIPFQKVSRVSEFKKTIRGESGFGSTGKN